jgi:hypothetical protein
MIEDPDDINEEAISRKKDKVLTKHFEILINDNRIKIINYIIKEKIHLERKGKIIRLISKYNLSITDRENVRIKINHRHKSISILGDWCVAYGGLGQYTIEYWINEIEEK